MHASRPLTLLVAAALIIVGLIAAAPRARAANVTFVLEMKGITFSPSSLRAEPGDNVTIVVFNNETGAVPHTFDLDAYGVHLGTLGDPIAQGESRSATFIARAGTFYFYCSMPGHTTNPGTKLGTGMVGTLQVGEASSSDPTAVIVVGLVILAVSLAAIIYFGRRGDKKSKSP